MAGGLALGFGFGDGVASADGKGSSSSSDDTGYLRFLPAIASAILVPKLSNISRSKANLSAALSPFFLLSYSTNSRCLSQKSSNLEVESYSTGLLLRLAVLSRF